MILLSYNFVNVVNTVKLNDVQNLTDAIFSHIKRMLYNMQCDALSFNQKALEVAIHRKTPIQQK